MNLFDKIKAFFGPGGVATPEQVQGLIEDLQAAHQRAMQAEQDVMDWRSENALAVLDDPAPSFERWEKARQARESLALALDQAQRKLAGLRDAEAARQASAAWDEFESQLSARAKHVARVQDLLSKLASEHKALLVATEAAWQAAPARPSARPATFGNDLSARLDMFLFGASGGRLGKGTSAHVDSQRPDLKTTAAEAHELMLSLRPANAQTEKATA